MVIAFNVQNQILWMSRVIKRDIIWVELQAGERARVTECPRLLSHRRATPAVTAFVAILWLKFLGVRNIP